MDVFNQLDLTFNQPFSISGVTVSCDDKTYLNE